MSWRIETEPKDHALTVRLVMPGGCLEAETSPDNGRRIAAELGRLLVHADRITEDEARAMMPPAFPGPSYHPWVLGLVLPLLAAAGFALGAWVRAG